MDRVPAQNGKAIQLSNHNSARRRRSLIAAQGCLSPGSKSIHPQPNAEVVANNARPVANSFRVSFLTLRQPRFEATLGSN